MNQDVRTELLSTYLERWPLMKNINFYERAGLTEDTTVVCNTSGYAVFTIYAPKIKQ